MRAASMSITCMELIEHVAEPAALLAQLSMLLRPGGDLFVSTINRNLRSFLVAIVGAEYLLNLIPRGTHEYARLLRPAELARLARAQGLALRDVSGVEFNPVRAHRAPRRRRPRQLPGALPARRLIHAWGARYHWPRYCSTWTARCSTPRRTWCVLPTSCAPAISCRRCRWPSCGRRFRMARRRCCGPAFPGIDAAPASPRSRARFLELYREQIALETRLFPGFEEVLAALEAQSHPVGCHYQQARLAHRTADASAGTVRSVPAACSRATACRSPSPIRCR